MEENGVSKWKVIIVILISIVILGYCGYKLGLFGGVDINKASTIETERKVITVGDSFSNSKLTEVVVNIMGEKIIVSDREVSLDEFKNYVSTLKEKATFTIMDSKAVRSIFEEVVKSIRDTGMEYKIKTN